MLRPTVDDERQLELLNRLEGWVEGELVPRSTSGRVEETTTVPWKENGLILRAVLFVLTLLGAAAFYFLCDKLWDFPELFTAVASLLLALSLTLRKRFLRTGVEEALYLGAGFSFVNALPDSGAKEGILLMAAAVGAAAWIVLNPLMAVAAVVLCTIYVDQKTGVSSVAGWVCLATALVALPFTQRTFRRPWTDYFVNLLTAVMPLVAYLYFRDGDVFREALLIRTGAWMGSVVVVGVLISVGLLQIVWGLNLRGHARLLSGIVLLGLVTGELLLRTTIPGEWQFVIGGLLALAAGTIAHRLLRSNPRGLTAKSIGTRQELQALELVNVAALTPSAPPSEPSGPQVETTSTSTESSFGGGGASGGY